MSISKGCVVAGLLRGCSKQFINIQLGTSRIASFEWDDLVVGIDTDRTRRLSAVVSQVRWATPITGGIGWLVHATIFKWPNGKTSSERCGSFSSCIIENKEMALIWDGWTWDRRGYALSSEQPLPKALIRRIEWRIIPSPAVYTLEYSIDHYYVYIFKPRELSVIRLVQKMD